MSRALVWKLVFSVLAAFMLATRRLDWYLPATVASLQRSASIAH